MMFAVTFFRTLHGIVFAVAGRQADRQAGRQAGRQADRQTGRTGQAERGRQTLADSLLHSTAKISVRGDFLALHSSGHSFTSLFAETNTALPHPYGASFRSFKFKYGIAKYLRGAKRFKNDAPTLHK